jgi:putative acetyltransferase
MIASQEIVLKPFQPEDQEAVKRLILQGLEDHWGVLDPTKNPDLDDIATNYANAVFLTAWKNERIIGTGALVPRGESLAEIVRMSVAGELRRHGVGKMILRALCRKATELGISRIVLETTETWHEVIAFYERNGFRVTHRQEGNVYFALDRAGDMEVEVPG